MIYAKRNILFQITSKLAKKLGFVGTIIKVFDSLHHKLFILKLQTSYLGFQESRGVLTLFDLKSAAELPEVQILDAITERILVSVIVAKFRYQVPAEVSRIFDRLQETLKNLVSTPKIRVSESRRIFQDKEFSVISF